MHRLRWALIGLGFAVLGVVLAFVLARQEDHADRIEAERDRREAVEDRLDEAQAASDALAEQLRALGEDPIVEPEDIPEADEVIVIPGPPGRNGRDGIDGKDGAAGKPGRDGTDGRDGADGQVGGRGPSCVEELGLEACQGPKGEPGQPGADGADGQDARCEGPFVCDSDLAGYATEAWVTALIRALGCEVAVTDSPGPPMLLTCTVTGKP